MTYKFAIWKTRPYTKGMRRSFDWTLEAHLTRFRDAREIGIGWEWRLNEQPTASVWRIGAELAETFERYLYPGVRLYSLGERVIVTPGAQGVTFTLEIT